MTMRTLVASSRSRTATAMSLTTILYLLLCSAPVQGFSTSAISFLPKSHHQNGSSSRVVGVLGVGSASTTTRTTTAVPLTTTVLNVSSQGRSFGKLGGFADDGDDEEYDDDELDVENCGISETFPTGSSPWELPNNFPLFLNQCAIQSFLFLLKSMRDPQTVLWIEDFTQPNIALQPPSFPKESSLPVGGSAKSKLLSYHGLGAMNTNSFGKTWETYFSKLLQEPGETYIVESASPYVPDYDLDINPASLCARMVSVREQIAREFVRDLDVVQSMGGHTLQSYKENLQEQQQKRQENATAADDADDPGIKIQRENLLFLDYNSNKDSDYAPSPLRKGNFDLLCLLTTQESIHRVLNGYTSNSKSSGKQPTDADKVAHYFLRNFYQARRVSHFSGSQRYGRADDFLEELLSTAPSLITVHEGVTLMVDPNHVAEIVLKEREAVAQEWKEMAANAPQEHMEIKRLQLNLLMGITPAPKKVDPGEDLPPPTAADAPVSEKAGGIEREDGAFE